MSRASLPIDFRAQGNHCRSRPHGRMVREPTERIRTSNHMFVTRTKSMILLIVFAVASVTAGCSDGADSATRGADETQTSVVPGRRDIAPLGEVELPPLEFAAVDDAGTVSADVTSEALFDFDSAELKPAVGELVDQIGERLAEQPSWMRIDGYTDGKGSEEYNLELSQRRADALTAVIVALGTAEDVQSCGRGELGTDGASDDPAARRVVITIRPSPFPEVCG